MVLSGVFWVAVPLSREVFIKQFCYQATHADIVFCDKILHIIMKARILLDADSVL